MKILKTFMKYAIGSLGTLVVGLITTPILTRLISTVEMGKYSMFITLGSLIASILYLGLDQSYVRFYNDEAPESRNYLLHKCLTYPLCASIMVVIILHMFYNQVSDIIIGESSLLIVCVFSTYLIALVIDRFWLLKLRMEQKVGAYSLLNILRKISYLMIALVLYFTVGGDQCWSLIVAVTLAEFILLLGIRIADKGKWKVENRNINVSTEEIVRYGIPFIFSTTIILIFQSTDKLMLKALSDYHQVGLYSGATNIVNLLTQVQLVFTTFWMPVSFEHFSKNPNDKQFFVRVNKVVSYIMLIFSIFLLCVKDIVILFLGPRYSEAVYVFPFLAFMPIMYTVSETTVMGINFMKKPKYHVVISIICAVANAIGNYELVIRFGAKGAAISTGLSYALFFVLRTFFSNRVYPVKYAVGRYIFSCVLVYVLAVMASFNPTNIKFIITAGGVFVVISVLYRDILRESYGTLKNIIKRKK